MGCAGVGVVSSSDPKVKLSDALNLLEQQDRPLLAEALIREAIEICEKNSDPSCLADSYKDYGYFFRSRSVSGKSSTYYQEHGFLDKSATFDTRYAKSVEYYKKSREIYARLEKYDAMTNVDLNIGFSYELMGDKKRACQAFDASSADNRENIQRNPDAHIALPKGVASFDEYLVPHRKRAGCQ
jgi:tetratricopeptide (TPR) repeat protein